LKETSKKGIVMDNYRTNRPGYGKRPGNYPRPNHYTPKPPRPTVPPCDTDVKSMYEQLDDLGLPVAMGYVPMTRFGKTFDPAAGLQNGTIFPDLCKPFCGKGGGGCK
jgi:hypothetical protein